MGRPSEPSLGATSGFHQDYAWNLDAGDSDDREHEHDGREPSEDELHFYDEANRASIHNAHKQAQHERLRSDRGGRNDTSHPCFRIAEANVVTSFEYTGVSELPRWTTLLGAVLIIGSGLLVLHQGAMKKPWCLNKADLEPYKKPGHC